MAHIRVLQIVKGSKAAGDTLKLLPVTFSTHREFLESKPKDGEYVFLEAHSITGEKEDDGQDKE